MKIENIKLHLDGAIILVTDKTTVESIRHMRRYKISSSEMNLNNSRLLFVETFLDRIRVTGAVLRKIWVTQ